MTVAEVGVLKQSLPVAIRISRVHARIHFDATHGANKFF